MKSIALLFCVLLGLLVSAPSEAQRKQPASPSSKIEWETRQRVQKSRPYRREAPLREANITDEEVREIQKVTAPILPGALVNISGVVTGCPCEDGPSCKDQVWVVAYRPELSKGLMLSKIDGRWDIGPVQSWWLRFDASAARDCGRAGRGEAAKTRWDACMAEQKALYESFPSCDVQPAGVE